MYTSFDRTSCRNAVFGKFYFYAAGRSFESVVFKERVG